MLAQEATGSQLSFLTFVNIVAYNTAMVGDTCEENMWCRNDQSRSNCVIMGGVAMDKKLFLCLYKERYISLVK